jgi:hypothetical protein
MEELALTMRAALRGLEEVKEKLELIREQLDGERDCGAAGFPHSRNRLVPSRRQLAPVGSPSLRGRCLREDGVAEGDADPYGARHQVGEKGSIPHPPCLSATTTSAFECGVPL